MPDWLPWNDVSVAGFAAAVLWALYRFLDKWLAKILDWMNSWAGKFYDVQAKQSEAMAILATRVTETSSDQRDTLIVMRSISASVERLHAEVGAGGERTGQVLDRMNQLEKKLGEGKWVGVGQ